MTAEERYEFEQELRDEAKQDEIEEYKLRNDYDYFLSRLENNHNLEEFIKWYKDICNEHEQYGYEFDIKELL